MYVKMPIELMHFYHNFQLSMFKIEKQSYSMWEIMLLWNNIFIFRFTV